MIHKLN